MRYNNKVVFRVQLNSWLSHEVNDNMQLMWQSNGDQHTAGHVLLRQRHARFSTTRHH